MDEILTKLLGYNKSDDQSFCILIENTQGWYNKLFGCHGAVGYTS